MGRLNVHFAPGSSHGQQPIKWWRKCPNGPAGGLYSVALLGRLRAGFSRCRWHAQLRGRKAHHGNGWRVRRMGKLQRRQPGKADNWLNGPTAKQTDRLAGPRVLRMSNSRTTGSGSAKKTGRRTPSAGGFDITCWAFWRLSNGIAWQSAANKATQRYSVANNCSSCTKNTLT